MLEKMECKIYELQSELQEKDEKIRELSREVNEMNSENTNLIEKLGQKTKLLDQLMKDEGNS